MRLAIFLAFVTWTASASAFACAFALEELVSGRGAEERYAPVASADRGLIFRHDESRRTVGDEVVEYRVGVKNAGTAPRFLRIVCRERIPFKSFDFWNGYLNQLRRDRTSGEGITALFPAIAALTKDRARVFGMNPMMCASRVDTECERDGSQAALKIAFPVYLLPGKSFTAHLAATTCKARYRWHDVVERWYEIFPKAFAVADGVHPGVAGSEAGYLFWYPEKYGLARGESCDRRLREVFGNQPFWEWCYKPFVRGGDWSITDELSVGWKGRTKEDVEKIRVAQREKLADGKRLNVATMWYLNVHWSETELMERYRDVIGGGSEKGSFWGQTCWNMVYFGGDSAFSRLFRQALERIPKEYPDVRGIGWDSCFANIEYPESNGGFAGTEPKSFRKGVPFVCEAVGVADLLDFNHAHFAGDGYRMANCVNYKLVAPWMIGVRTDCGLYEGTPMTRPERFWRLEAMRARLGPKKVVTWHKGCSVKELGWAKLDGMSAEAREDAHRQILDDNLFLSYYWGVAVPGRMNCEHGERYFGALRELVDLITSGWHPSPAVDAPEGVFVARYGDGKGTCLAVINPGFAEREVELVLPGDYWPQFPKGRKLKLVLPARQVMIAGPDFSRPAQPCATLPPVKPRKIFRPTFEELMSQSRIDGSW